MPNSTWTLSEFKPGDLVRIRGADDHGHYEQWNAEVTGTLRPYTIEVCILQHHTQGIARFSQQYDHVHIDSIEMHVPAQPHDLEAIAIAWKHLGYIPLDETDFWTHGVPIHPAYPVPCFSPTYSAILARIYAQSNTPHLDALIDDDPHQSEIDWASSSDDDDELFTVATDDSHFVRETHAAVQQMSQRYCITDTPRQKSVRDFLNYLHYKYR